LKSHHSNDNAVATAPAKNTIFFQAKLTVNEPGDVYEQQAEVMAEHVMRMPDPSTTENVFFKPAISSVQRKCENCEEEEKQMQRKESNGGEVTDSVQTENYIQSLSGGKALNKQEKNFFEARMGYDFS
jgi:hypothetical protein